MSAHPCGFAPPRLRTDGMRVHLGPNAAVGKAPLRRLNRWQREHLLRDAHIARGVLRRVALREPGAQLRAQGILFPGNAHSALRMMEKISSCFSSSARSAPSFINGTIVQP